jgi:hypothetical protein
MNTRNLYGVFIGTKWAMTTTKRHAIKRAKQDHGIVYVIEGGMGQHWASARYWDAPTFKATGTVVADYRLQLPSKP